MHEQKKYYLQLISVCTGALMISYGLSQIPNKYFSTNHFWIPTLFFALSTLGVNALLTQ